MTKNPLISILIPSFNRIDYIKDTINSAISQTYNNIEIIIYDDGSTDGTQELIKSITSKYNNIKYIACSENKGVGYSRNKLMSLANGEYLAWLDSDDLIHESRIEILYNKIINLKCDIIYSRIQRFLVTPGDIIKNNYITIDHTKYDKNDFESLKNNTVCASALFNKKLIKYKFIEDLRLGSEDVLWLFTLLQYNVKICYSDLPLYYYRSHINRISNIKKRNSMKELKKIENLKIKELINKIKKLHKKN